ncbi:MAG: hypothetical protein HYX76_01975 [Acidobacteria bacterium]|nr:hypothetical protein [Acidobacteriota bacterium]
MGLLFTAGPLLLAPILLAAFPQGPFPGMTGGFGEPSCRKCHFDQPLNDPGGSLRLSGIPRSFRRGTEYTITVRLARAELRRGGFQLSARIATGARAGDQAGRLAAADAAVQVITSLDGKIEYAQHALVGTAAPVPGAVEWKLKWTAPTAAVPVVFHVAGNAANADDSALGDYIYLRSARSLPRITTAPGLRHED